jgi:hypothetical protein
MHKTVQTLRPLSTISQFGLSVDLPMLKRFYSSPAQDRQTYGDPGLFPRSRYRSVRLEFVFKDALFQAFNSLFGEQTVFA